METNPVFSHLSSAAEMKPFPSLSKTLKASLISSSVSVSFIFLAIMVRNSGKSMVPFPSESTSLIMSWSSASVGFCPRDLGKERKDTIYHCISLQAIPHDGSELLGGDGAVSILVKQREGFFELGNLVFSQLFGHLVGTSGAVKIDWRNFTSERQNFNCCIVEGGDGRDGEWVQYEAGDVW